MSYHEETLRGNDAREAHWQLAVEHANKQVEAAMLRAATDITTTLTRNPNLPAHVGRKPLWLHVDEDGDWLIGGDDHDEPYIARVPLTYYPTVSALWRALANSIDHEQITSLANQYLTDV